jgi:hypothetical protein
MNRVVSAAVVTLALALNGCQAEPAYVMFSVEGDQERFILTGMSAAECTGAAAGLNAFEHSRKRTRQWRGCELQTPELLALVARQRAQMRARMLEAADEAEPEAPVVGDFTAGEMGSTADLFEAAEGTPEPLPTCETNLQACVDYRTFLADAFRHVCASLDDRAGDDCFRTLYQGLH